MAHLIAQGVGFLKNLAASTWTRSRRESDILSLSIDAKDNCHIAWMEVEFRGEWIHIYVWLSLFAVRLTITTLLIGCCCLVAKLCLTLCDPMDCSLPGFSVRGVSQARILDWVAISFSSGSSDPGIKPTCLLLQADSLPVRYLGSTAHSYFTIQLRCHLQEF